MNCICWCFVNRHYSVQLGEDAYDALDCRSLSTKEPLNIGLFCGKWPTKIRHPTGLCHPVICVHVYDSYIHLTHLYEIRTHAHTRTRTHTHTHTHTRTHTHSHTHAQTCKCVWFANTCDSFICRTHACEWVTVAHMNNPVTHCFTLQYTTTNLPTHMDKSHSKICVFPHPCMFDIHKLGPIHEQGLTSCTWMSHIHELVFFIIHIDSHLNIFTCKNWT